MASLTLFEKVWREHEVVPERPDTPAVLYIDLHLVHEVSSPQAFSLLRSLRLPLRRPARTLATMDHSTPTLTEQVSGNLPIKIEAAAAKIRQLEQNAAAFGIELFGLRDTRRGIVHVISAEQGATQPGMTVVCGDSHTSTHGAFGCIAFGIGSTEVAHVLATQCLLQRKPKTFAVNVRGKLGDGVTAKDLATPRGRNAAVQFLEGFVQKITSPACTRRRLAERRRSTPHPHPVAAVRKPRASHRLGLDS